MDRTTRGVCRIFRGPLWKMSLNERPLSLRDDPLLETPLLQLEYSTTHRINATMIITSKYMKFVSHRNHLLLFSPYNFKYVLRFLFYLEIAYFLHSKTSNPRLVSNEWFSKYHLIFKSSHCLFTQLALIKIQIVVSWPYCNWQIWKKFCQIPWAISFH